MITNPTGVNASLKSSVDILYENPDIKLTALFGPEHGVRGDAQAGDEVGSYIDEKPGFLYTASTENEETDSRDAEKCRCSYV